MKIPICCAIWFMVTGQVLAQSTFVGQVDGLFQIQEGSATASGYAPIDIYLTTDYSSLGFEFRWDADILLAGGPEESFETRLEATGRYFSSNTSDLTFPDSQGSTYTPGRIDLNWENQFAVTERVVSFEQRHESAMLTGTRRFESTRFGVAAYPDSVSLWTRPYPFNSDPSLGELSTQSESSIELRLSFDSSYVDATLTELLPGDFNSDAVVNSADYTVWRDVPGFLAPLLTDSGVWRDNYGAIAIESTASPAPKPTAVGLLGCVGLVVGLRLRRD